MTDPHAENVSKEAAAEHLRQLIPLMQKHGIPATPENYTVWYEYITGTNAALKADIDILIAEQTPFTSDINADLHERHIRECTLADRTAPGRIADILSDLLQELNAIGEETGRYDAKLQSQLELVQNCRDMQSLESLLIVLADETKHMRRTTQQLREDFEHRSREIMELQDELQLVKRTATSDPLTGLPNRRALLDAMGEQAAQKATARHSLVMIDIDNFKAINDHHGHLIGDRVIRFVADVIRQNTKGQDTPARFGGEEYAILLPNTQLAGALAVAESIRHAISIARLVRSANQDPLGQITISAGVATYRTGEDSMELLERADQSLYLAKERGRNKVVPETAL
jgi:diguanylate cyclase